MVKDYSGEPKKNSYKKSPMPDMVVFPGEGLGAYSDPKKNS